MPEDWKTIWIEWKRRFPLYRRVFYWIVGYPPMYQLLSEESWERWKDRFNGAEYDWQNHSDTKKQ